MSGQEINYINYAKKETALFSVHSVKALEEKQFSIVHANIENTPDKIELARSVYPIEHFHFEFHEHEIDMRFVIS